MQKDPVLDPYEALRAIQFVIGLFLVVSGAYLLAPWDILAPSSIWASTAETFPAYVGFMGGTFVVAGVAEVWAAKRGYHNKWTRFSKWVTVAIFIFFIINRIITAGVLPVLWLYPACLLGISLVMALAIRTR